MIIFIVTSFKLFQTMLYLRQQRRVVLLSEDRYEIILDHLNKMGSASIKQLSEIVGTSESTIRRDLSTLAEKSLLTKVYGGATSIERNIRTEEPDMKKKHLLHGEEKQAIGRYAASLVKKHDFVFIDAGTTAEAIVEFLTQKDAIYMTNGIFTAQLLAARGFDCYVVGGVIRAKTEAVVGDEAIKQIQDCNFSIGFFGTNGITVKNGFTTPNLTEAAFKETALNQTLHRYVLADPSKFGKVYPKTFASIDKAEIITTQLSDRAYRDKTRITEVKLDLHSDI